MQRDSIELGAVHDQHPGRQSILEDAVATFCAYRIRYSSRHFTERISHPRNRASLCECRPADDPQHNPPSWWACLFRAFADSISFRIMVPAQGGRPKPTTEIGLSFEHFSLRKFWQLCHSVSVEALVYDAG
jgi:hypothetical protein